MRTFKEKTKIQYFFVYSDDLSTRLWKRSQSHSEHVEILHDLDQSNYMVGSFSCEYLTKSNLSFSFFCPVIRKMCQVSKGKLLHIDQL